ncbi:methyltransferase family protein [Kushneria sinocarnis]|uniref:Methyltransferase family protein n=1 Tax=Kushneria sinocarnis TaxID=595502 RepID=A0A420X0V1_9GAMM|nr:class I SAM-dependent methyltransferase [Kushneria sinocarnis]RKR07377.1 methyltransferase family protein [Kushneria sinocarnis]
MVDHNHSTAAENTERDGRNHVQQMLSLDGEAQKLKARYRGWSQGSNRTYHVPGILCDFMTEQTQRHSMGAPGQLHILDAGCGSGLIGQALSAHGFTWLDGFDLNDSVIVEARKCEVYDQLRGGVDMNGALDYDTGSFDVVVCCGVFNDDNVDPEALGELLRITRPGGLVMISTQQGYDERHGFEAWLRTPDFTRMAERIHHLVGAPYSGRITADYHTFRIHA